MELLEGDIFACTICSAHLALLRDLISKVILPQVTVRLIAASCDSHYRVTMTPCGVCYVIRALLSCQSTPHAL